MSDQRKKAYVQRDYRSLHKGSDLHYFTIQIRESDLAIGVDIKSYTEGLLSLCRKELARLRGELEDYIVCDPDFRNSLVPVRLLPAAPPIVQSMAAAAMLCNVGPMAAVAGAIAQGIGEMLKEQVQELIVENGGDIYMHTHKERTIAVFAGQSRFSQRLGIKVYPEESPLGICTSSGTVGPSLSFGSADAVLIKSPTAALADAAASRAGNIVRTAEDAARAIDAVKGIPGITGTLIIKDETLAAWGNIELVPL